jgi:hypothetical protein
VVTWSGHPEAAQSKGVAKWAAKGFKLKISISCAQHILNYRGIKRKFDKCGFSKYNKLSYGRPLLLLAFGAETSSNATGHIMQSGV